MTSEPKAPETWSKTVAKARIREGPSELPHPLQPILPSEEESLPPSMREHNTSFPSKTSIAVSHKCICYNNSLLTSLETEFKRELCLPCLQLDKLTFCGLLKVNML